MKVSANGVMKFVFGILFTLFLSASILLYVFYYVTSFSHLKMLLPKISKNELNANVTSSVYNYMIKYCHFYNSSITLPLPRYSLNISISCSEVRHLSKDNFTYYLMNKALEKLYFRNVNCTGINCFKEPRYLISYSFNKKAFEYLEYSLLLSAIFGIIYLYFIKNWKERFKSLSVILFSNSVPYFLTLFYLKNVGVKYSYIIVPTLERLSSIFIAILVLAVVFGIGWFLLRKDRKK